MSGIFPSLPNCARAGGNMAEWAEHLGQNSGIHKFKSDLMANPVQSVPDIMPMFCTKEIYLYERENCEVFCCRKQGNTPCSSPYVLVLVVSC